MKIIFIEFCYILATIPNLLGKSAASFEFFFFFINFVVFKMPKTKKNKKCIQCCSLSCSRSENGKRNREQSNWGLFNEYCDRSKNKPIKLHNRLVICHAFRELFFCLSKDCQPAASMDFDSLLKEFLGALPSGFEGMKRLASQRVRDYFSGWREAICQQMQAFWNAWLE